MTINDNTLEYDEKRVKNIYTQLQRLPLKIKRGLQRKIIDEPLVSPFSSLSEINQKVLSRTGHSPHYTIELSDLYDIED